MHRKRVLPVRFGSADRPIRFLQILLPAVAWLESRAGTDDGVEETGAGESGLFSDVPAALLSAGPESAVHATGARLDVTMIAIKPNRKVMIK